LLYQYDQLNRIKDAQGYGGNNFANGQWQVTAADGEMYRNQFTYCANGNILTQLRNDRLGNPIDNISYGYKRVGNTVDGKLLQNRRRSPLITP
jgi:hypothetical protein